jgi:hypothetical protein
MTTLRPLTVLMVLALGAANAACVRAPTAQIANPLASGSVGENELKFFDRQNEQQFGVPSGTLEHDASLVSADDHEICFKVALHTPRKDLSSPKNWRVFLRGKPDFEDMSPKFKDIAPVGEETVSGSTLLSSLSNQQVCDNTGYCVTKTVTHSTRVPQDVKVLSGGGTVCFANAGHLNIDPARIIVAGESGGGNLTLATGLKLKQDGELGLIKGLYALCPYIAGQWPTPECPSSKENNGILLDVHDNRGAVGYGIEAFTARSPLAWPSFATAEDVQGFPPTIISVNECDPLRDEGINFYRLLLRAGVPARCRQVMGTMHGTEIFTVACPEISRDTARDIAAFCQS